MKGRVLYKKILVRPDPVEERTEGGIIKVWEDKGTDIKRGTVLKVGQGFLNKDGAFVPLQLKEGDHILYHKNVGIDVKIEDEDLVIIASEDQILFVEED